MASLHFHLKMFKEAVQFKKVGGSFAKMKSLYGEQVWKLLGDFEDTPRNKK